MIRFLWNFVARHIRCINCFSVLCLGLNKGKCPVIRATFSCNLTGNIVALQAGIICCAYYHLLAQQIFMLQKVDVALNFCNITFVARGGGNTRNKQSQLATPNCCPTRWTKMLLVLLSLNRGEWNPILLSIITLVKSFETFRIFRLNHNRCNFSLVAELIRLENNTER